MTRLSSRATVASMLMSGILIGAGFLADAAPLGRSEPNLALRPIGSYASGIFNLGSAEIVAHDPTTQRLYVVNAQAATVDVLNIANPTTPTKIATLNLTDAGGVANSVAAHGGVIAVALEAAFKTNPGKVVFFDSALTQVGTVTVGALPDMLKFTPNGRFVLVANEGEPNSYNSTDPLNPSIDPEGSVSIIDLSGGVANVTQENVRTVGFTAFNDQEAALKKMGIRIYGPNATVAQDLEPEYIAVSFDSRTAWVTLQENNALAVIDILAGEVTQLIPLGFKDHSLAGNGLDGSDQDTSIGNGINIRPWPILGIYNPDAIDAYQFQNQTYLVTANEGDIREWSGFREDVRLSTRTLDPVAFPGGAALLQNTNLGRLAVSTVDGDIDGDGDLDEIYSYGGRSFSVWNAATGELAFDSGDQFEQITAALHRKKAVVFNASHGNNTFDNRSSSKGPEPEGVTLGRAFGRVWAFIGLERIGGVMVYDVTNPHQPRFSNYINNRNFTVAPSKGTIPPAALPNTGDLGPEGLIFITEENSPNGKPLLVMSHEVSGTTTIFEISKEK